jgi:purine-binding chemotaxis protein CheW
VKKNKLVVFSVDNQQFAVHLSNVERIVRIVEIDSLPLAPEYIAGTINFHGEFLAVVNMRKLFFLTQREAYINDQLIIMNTTSNKVALWVDSVNEIVEYTDDDISDPRKILLDVGYVEGLFKMRDGMVLIHDLDKFLIPAEIAKLTEALLKKRVKEEEREKEGTKVVAKRRSLPGGNKRQKIKVEEVEKLKNTKS